jgi:hypothetical protein
MTNLDAAAGTALASPKDEDVEQLSAGIAAHDLQEEEPWRSPAVENFLRSHTASVCCTAGLAGFIMLKHMSGLVTES